MNATFLVEVDVEDPTQIIEDCNEIQDALEAAGLAVNSVKPWTRPTMPTLIPKPL